MNLFENCPHDWEVIVNEYEKSQLEKISDNKQELDGTFSRAMVRGKKIIILQCKKCGKLNKTIEKI